MDFTELITGFAARHAVENLDADGGVAVLDIDGTEVTLREDADAGVVLATAAIGEMPPDANGVFASLALQANYAAVGGVALSVDADTDELAATASLPLALADPDSLSDAVETLVNTAEEWRRNAAAFLAVDEEAEIADANNESASPPLSTDFGFLRV